MENVTQEETVSAIKALQVKTVLKGNVIIIAQEMENVHLMAFAYVMTVFLELIVLIKFVKINAQIQDCVSRVNVIVNLVLQVNFAKLNHVVLTVMLKDYV